MGKRHGGLRGFILLCHCEGIEKNICWRIRRIRPCCHL